MLMLSGGLVTVRTHANANKISFRFFSTHTNETKPPTNTAVFVAMDCIVCSTSLVHLFFEPMTMGCKCSDRVCQRCVKIGDIHKCPQCRKPKKVPTVDKAWLKTMWRKGDPTTCLGCNRDVHPRSIHKHERKCVKYRAMMDKLFEEDIAMRRVQADTHRRQIEELEDRVEFQNELIDDLEDRLEHQKVQTQRTNAEQGRVLNTLDSILQPLFMGVRSLDGIYTQLYHTRTALRTIRRSAPATGLMLAPTHAFPQQPPPPPHLPNHRRWNTEGEEDDSLPEEGEVGEEEQEDDHDHEEDAEAEAQGEDAGADEGTEART